MAILIELVDLLDKSIGEVGGTYNGLKVCELGDQVIKWHQDRTCKQYMINKGVKEHISLDMNGRHGALRVDLSIPTKQWIGYFDMVTNFGTAEHVENGIYTCFENIHKWTRDNGVMVHVGPPAGGCPWHSPYHFERWFFEKLAEKCNYKLVFSDYRVVTPRRIKNLKEVDHSVVCAIYVKKPDSKFISYDEFKNINGIEGLK